MAGENGERAVELFGENDAGKFVGHSQRGQRNLLRGFGAEIVGKTFGVTAKEGQFAHAAVAKVAEPLRELL